MTSFLIPVRQEVKSKDNSLVVHGLEIEIKRDLFGLLWYLGNQYNVRNMLRMVFVLRQWFSCCWFIVFVYLPLFVGVLCWLCFGMHYFMSFLVLQPSWRGRGSWLLCSYCLLDVLLLVMSCSSSARCHGLACSLFLWYFLVVLTYFLPWSSPTNTPNSAAIWHQCQTTSSHQTNSVHKLLHC